MKHDGFCFLNKGNVWQRVPYERMGSAGNIYIKRSPLKLSIDGCRAKIIAVRLINIYVVEQDICR